MATVAANVARILRSAGVSYMFGYPGGEVVEFMDEARKEGISFILTRHENAAAFAAGVTGQLTGAPGVCVSTLGPGATNMATGVANAWMDRDPLIAITGQISTSRRDIATHQVMDVNAFYRPITKWSVTLEPGSAAQVMLKCLRIATADRPGPVHVCIPSNIAKADAGPAVEESLCKWLTDQPVPSSEAIARAARAISFARRPVIAAGMGVVRSGASGEFVRFAERLGAPVVVAPKAKGAIPEDHPLFAGVLEMLGDAVVLRLVDSADLIIACGLDVVELDKPWGFRAPVIHVDTLPNADEYYRAHVEVVGDLHQTLAALGERVERAAGWTMDELEDVRRELNDLISRRGGCMTPLDAVRLIRAKVPRDAIATCDVGAHKFLMGQAWTTYSPNTFLVSNGLSSMGYGIPAAIAAQMLFPERPVVAVVGDGGFGMYMGEIETAVRLGLRMLVVVMSDEHLSLIAMGQEKRGLPQYGVSFTRSDLARVAEGLGAAGYIAEDLRQLDACVDKWLSDRRLTVIQANVDPQAYRLR